MTVREFITRWGFDVDFGPLEKMESETKKLRKGFIKLGAAATATLAGIVVPAATLEDALRKSAAAAGKTGEDFNNVLRKITGQTMDFAEELGLAGNQIATGFFNVISTGLDPLSKEFDDFSKTAFQLAKLTGADVGTTVSQLNTVLVNFRKNGETASSIANKFAKANTLADTSVAQLAEAAQIAGPVVAKNFGGDLNETIGILAGFAEAGFKAERGGESLKQVALRLSAPIGKAGGQLKQLGIQTTNADGSFRNLIDIIAQLEASTVNLTESQRAQALTNIFGQETIGKFSALLGVGSKRLAQLSKDVDNADGSLALALDQMEGLVDVGRKLWQSIKNIAITFGTPLLAPLTKITKGFLELVTGFRALLKENPRVAQGLALVTGGLLGLTIATSGVVILITSFKLLRLAVLKTGTAFLLTQIKAFAFIGAVILAGALLFALFDDLLALFTDQESILGDLISKHSELDTGIKALIASVGILAFTVGLMTIPWITLLAVFVAVGIAIYRNRKEWGEFFDMLARDPLGDTITDFGLWLTSIIGIEEAVKNLFDQFKEFRDWLSNNTWGDIGKEFTGWLSDLTGVGKLVDTLKAAEASLGIGSGRGQTMTSSPGNLSALAPLTAPLGPSTAPITGGGLLGGGGQTLTGGNRSVNLEVGGINISGVTDPVEVGRIVRQELDDVVREAGDTLE